MRPHDPPPTLHHRTSPTPLYPRYAPPMTRSPMRPLALTLAAVLFTACDQSAIRPSQPAKPAAQPAPRSPRFGSAESSPKPAGAIRLVSYNVENLFDDHDDPALSGEHEDAEETKPAAHLEALAATIRTLSPDILAVQEVESERALLWFRDAYLADMGYAHIASPDAGDERGIEQSVLSRHPIVEVKSWPREPLGGVHPEKWGTSENFNAGQPITFHRSPLLVTIEVPAGADAAEPYRLSVVVVHHKSGREGGYWRDKEAAKTVELLAALQRDDPDRNIAVVGDFNAIPTDASVAAYTSAGLIDLFSDRRPGAAEWITHESGRTIDFILVNPSLAAELVPGSRFILGTPARPEGADWRTTPPPVGYASDHYPLVVDLTPDDK
jgi:endonuclease/exonuclease/phosphatase family metal-dependent hydrolase